MSPRTPPPRRRRPPRPRSSRILTLARDIATARRRLATLWKASSVDVGDRTLGHPRGRFPARLHWNARHGIWGSFPPLGGESRYWNAFGLADPTEADALTITVEVNVDPRGQSRAVQGVFVEDPQRGLTLAHRGRVNVGNRGITREDVLRRYSGETVGVENERLLVVARLDEPDVVGQCARWVREIEKIKDALRPPPRTPTRTGQRKRHPALPPTKRPPDPERQRRLGHLLFR